MSSEIEVTPVALATNDDAMGTDYGPRVMKDRRARRRCESPLSALIVPRYSEYFQAAFRVSVPHPVREGRGSCEISAVHSLVLFLGARVR